MKLLVIDTAGPVCAAGIFDADKDELIASVSETIGKGHAEKLPLMVESITKASEAGFSGIGRIAVTTGPGSFTGIRVGVAFARGLAVAASVPVVGVSTLRVVAEPVLEVSPPAPVLALIDARRDELYGQVFSPRGEALTEPAAYSYDRARDAAARFGAILTGSGARVLKGQPSPQIDAFPLNYVGRIGAGLDEQSGASPLYIRGADAKPQLGFAVAHVAPQQK